MTSSLLVLIGLAVGSFVNVVIMRLPQGRSFIGGRSHCMHCKHTLAWYDLIPLVSYLIQKGKCRYCSKSVSWQYPFVEAYSAFAVVFSYYLLADGGLIFWIWSVFLLEMFLIIAVIDIKHLIIPDGILISILIVSIGLSFFANKLSFESLFGLDNLLSALVLMAVFFAIWFFSRGLWLGFGDVKLAGVIGFVLGYPDSVIAVYLGIILGFLIGIILLIFRQAGMKTKMPLGTFLAAAVSAYLLFGLWIEPFVLKYLTFLV
ncbi:MAG: prepilin peptidase [Parcubacteria group bacterium]